MFLRVLYVEDDLHYRVQGWRPSWEKIILDVETYLVAIDGELGTSGFEEVLATAVRHRCAEN